MSEPENPPADGTNGLHRVVGQWPGDEMDERYFNALARVCERIRAYTQAVERMLRQGDAVAFSLDLLAKVQGENEQMLRSLIDSGAEVPTSFIVPPLLHELEDTEATRELSRILGEARDVAHSVDKERGWSEAGIAEAVEDLAERMKVKLPSSRTHQ